MSKEELPVEADQSLGAQDLVSVLEALQGEHAVVTVATRPLQPAVAGENDDAFVWLRGRMTIQIGKLVRVTIAERGDSDALGSVRFHAGDIESAKLRTFEGTEYFEVTVWLTTVVIRVAHDDLS